MQGTPILWWFYSGLVPVPGRGRRLRYSLLWENRSVVQVRTETPSVLSRLGPKGITLHLRRFLGRLYPILTHPIAQRLMTHAQHVMCSPLPGDDPIGPPKCHENALLLLLALLKRLLRALVKAPFSWPNSSLSISPAGSVAQLTETKACWWRGLRAWIVRASKSLPTPATPQTAVGGNADVRGVIKGMEILRL